jgi:hypothetical protein
MNFEFPILISLIPVAIGFSILLVGLLNLLKVNSLSGSLVSAFGIIFLVVFGPTLFLDKVQIDPDGIFQSTGLWFSQTQKGFKFSDLDRVLITEGRDMKNRTIEIWVAEYKSGESVTIDPGDLWESNGLEIIEYMKKKGLEIGRLGKL